MKYEELCAAIIDIIDGQDFEEFDDPRLAAERIVTLLRDNDIGPIEG